MRKRVPRKLLSLLLCAAMLLPMVGYITPTAKAYDATFVFGTLGNYRTNTANQYLGQHPFTHPDLDWETYGYENSYWVTGPGKENADSWDYRSGGTIMHSNKKLWQEGPSNSVFVVESDTANDYKVGGSSYHYYFPMNISRFTGETTVTFDYKVSSFDYGQPGSEYASGLMVIADKTVILMASGEESGSVTYVFDQPGTHVITWIYNLYCDEEAVGAYVPEKYYAEISNGHYSVGDPVRTDATAVMMGMDASPSLMDTSVSHPFASGSTDLDWGDYSGSSSHSGWDSATAYTWAARGDNTFVSSNKGSGYDHTYAPMTYTFSGPKELSFDYEVSSAQNGYEDGLMVIVDDKVVLMADGTASDTFTYNVETEGEHQVTWLYNECCGSSDSGHFAMISNIKAAEIEKGPTSPEVPEVTPDPEEFGDIVIQYGNPLGAHPFTPEVSQTLDWETYGYNENVCWVSGAWASSAKNWAKFPEPYAWTRNTNSVNHYMEAIARDEYSNIESPNYSWFSMYTTINGAGTISFTYDVAADRYTSAAYRYIAGLMVIVDGKVVMMDDGVKNNVPFSYTFTRGGPHTIIWIYSEYNADLYKTHDVMVKKLAWTPDENFGDGGSGDVGGSGEGDVGRPGTTVWPDSTGAIQGAERSSDRNTMQSYQQVMLTDDWGSRYAGRMWADLSVFANTTGTASVELTSEDDGYDGKVSVSEDFLHVFSVLGSSQQSETATPIDMVLVLDVSSSMGSINDPESKISRSVSALNETVDTLMRLNQYNRVAIVVFGEQAKVLLPLSRVEKREDGQYVIAEEAPGYEGIRYSLTGPAPISPAGQAVTVLTVDIADGGIGKETNLDEGLWLGLTELANAQDTVKDINGPVSAIPACIVLGDGVPNIAMMNGSNNENDGYNSRNRTQWWNPVVGSSNRITWSTYYDGGQPGVIIPTMLRAAYMKARVVSHYVDAAASRGVKDISAVEEMPFYSVAIEIGSTGGGANEELSARALLDPANYFKSDNRAQYESLADYYPDDEYSFTDPSGHYTYVIQYAYNQLENLLRSSSDVPARQIYNLQYNSSIYLDPLHDDIYGIDADTVLYNIEYIDRCFEAEKASRITGAVADIVSNIIDEAFIPVAGENDTGVQDHVTFINPLGKYMEVKHVPGILLFGEMQGMVKYAVYDYEFNDAYMTAKGEQYQPFASGWYLGDDGATAILAAEGEAGEVFPDGYYTSQEAWDAGYVYRVGYSAAINYIPTLAEADGPDSLTEKQMNTVYTLYRFTADGRHLYRMNSSLGAGEVYDDEGNLNPGAYRLSDIRVWVEDTGDYNDDLVENGALEIDVGFDQALYVDIPADALPFQMARIIVGNGDEVESYRTNLNLQKACPLRVFYSVGIQNEVKTSDGADVDMDLIEEEYLTSHTVTQEMIDAGQYSQDQLNAVYFLSTWYTANRYSDYVTEGDRTYGDAVVTFSPSADNRYYIFQKPLPLFTTAYQWNGSDFEKVVGRNGSDEDFANWEGGKFAGMFETLDEATFGRSVYENGDIIFIKSDAKSDAINENSYYFLAVDYFAAVDPSSTTSNIKEGEQIQYVIARKGAEFLAVNLDNVHRTDNLCWVNLDEDYLDDDRYVEEDYYTKPDGAGTWVLAAQPGGIRVGDLAQSIGTKGFAIGEGYNASGIQNETNTAANYYLPTISQSSSSTGSDEATNVAVNIYLGNNGIMTIAERGSITVSKEVQGVSTDSAFTFEIELIDKNGTKLNADVPLEGGGVLKVRNGKGVFELHDGESITLTELSKTINYFLTETDSKGYTASWTNGEGTVSAEGVTATCINTLSDKPDDKPSDVPGGGSGGGGGKGPTITKPSKPAEPTDTGVSKWLNTVDHMAYLSGYTDGTFGPTKNMTRAEAAQMFYNLLLNKNVRITTHFDDVADDAWYATAVNTLASLGIVTGVGDNRYDPMRPVTRAEFVTMVIKFADKIPDTQNIFSDVKRSDWFYTYVMGAVAYGWVSGYAEGSGYAFHPNATITRAEAASIMNNVLGRAADEDYVDRHVEHLKQFSDLSRSYWAYYIIREATNGHDYDRPNTGNELWTGLWSYNSAR